MDKLQFEPMTVGQILDRTFRLWRANFVRYIAMVAVVLVPLRIVQFFWQTALIGAANARDPSLAVPIIGAIVVIILAVVGQNLSRAALMKSISESYLGGEATVGQSYRAILPRLGGVILASVMVGLVVGLGFLLLVVPGIIFSLWYALTIPVLILEGSKAGASMGRSRALVSGNLGKVFVLALVVFLITWIIGAAFGLIGRQVGLAVSGQSVRLLTFVSSLFSLVSEILTVPISAAAYILLYYDLRIRKEGFDLEMLAQSLRTKGTIADAPPTTP